MDLRFATEVPADPTTTFEVVGDLFTYPRWLELVRKVEPTEPAAGDGGPAYLVDLRARLGPLARSKRLRMVRHQDEPSTAVRFVRRELDGRDHARWELRASVAPTGSGPTSTVEVELHYAGSLWAAPLELALRSHVAQAIPRLRALVTATP